MDVVMNPNEFLVSDEENTADQSAIDRKKIYSNDKQNVSVFTPAYYDTQTDTVYISRYSDGSVAPVHVLDLIPDELLNDNEHKGELSKKVIVGFVFNDRFYTRAQALEAWNRLAEEDAAAGIA